jgi:DnaK suppressor protein
MNKRELKKFEKLLLDERAKLVGSIRNIESASRNESGRQSAGDLSSYAETGTDNFELETALNIASAESDRLMVIDECLERIADGTYGECEMCEETIPRPRLEVFPAARYCVGCQSQIEKEKNSY